LTTVKETIETINRMQADGVIVAYAIGGAVGASFHLEPMATMDLDVFVSFRGGEGKCLIDLSPLYAWIKAHGLEVRGEHVVMGGWPVQFLPSADALGEEALKQAITTRFENVATRVMTAEHLVALALQLGRAKDHARILQFIEAGVLDAKKLDGILQRHGLTGRWADFGKRFLEQSP